MSISSIWGKSSFDTSGEIVCPIPRCAAEILLGLMWFSLGLALLISSHELTFINMYGSKGHAVRLVWGVLLWVPGAFQCASLLFKPRALHRWAAFFTACVGVLFTSSLFTAPDVPTILAPVLVMTIGEVVIYWLLRGARWRD